MGALVGKAADGIGEREHRAVQRRIDPLVAIANVGGVGGEPFAQLEASRAGHFGQVAELGPGPLGVNMVGGERTDSAPVVDSGANEQLKF